MLFGEHAVLRNKLAIVCAVDQFIEVSLTPRSDAEIIIQSEQFGEFHTQLNNIAIESPYQYILAVLQAMQRSMSEGCEITIKSEIHPNLGLGSSAAVTAATLNVINDWLSLGLDQYELHATGSQVIKKVQGQGSGADLAASLFGGVVAYRMQPNLIEPLHAIPNLSLIYSGAKTTTPTVINYVDNQVAKDPEFFDLIFQAMEICTMNAVQSIQAGDFAELGVLMQRHQSLQASLGVCNYALADILTRLQQVETVLGAKISGSGLGDCVIAMGEFSEELLTPEYPLIPINVISKEKSCA